MAERRKLSAAEMAAAAALAARLEEHGAIPRLAERVGVTPAAVGHWTRGEIPVPLRRAGAVAAAVGIDDPGDICIEWREHVAPFVGRPSQPMGLDDATMTQAVELLHMLADLRPDDVRFRRISWHAIQITAKAIKRAEGSHKDAVRMILEEIAEDV